MKILIVHQYYLFPGQPGGSRFNEFARLWTSADHEVTVIAGNQNYSTGQTPEEFRNRWAVKTSHNDITVWRCHVPRTYNTGTLGRMWAFAGFTLSSAWACFKVAKPDIVITTSPPLTVAFAGWLLTRARFRHVKWVFEVRDLWPESAISTGAIPEGSWLARISYRLEAWGYAKADVVNVLTPAFRDDLIRRRVADPSKIVTISNGADLELFTPASRTNSIRTARNWADKFVLLYAGAHGRANAVHQLVEAAANLRDRRDILFATVGDGPERAACIERASVLGLDNVDFIGPVAKEQMPDYINAADVGVAVLQANPTFTTVYPNKMFDYMACARPTLLAIDGAARALVCDDARAGVFARPEDAQDIANQARWLADHSQECSQMGLRGLAWARANASREALASRYLTILKELVSCTTPRPANASSTS